MKLNYFTFKSLIYSKVRLGFVWFGFAGFSLSGTTNNIILDRFKSGLFLCYNSPKHQQNTTLYSVYKAYANFCN